MDLIALFESNLDFVIPGAARNLLRSSVCSFPTLSAPEDLGEEKE